MTVRALDDRGRCCGRKPMVYKRPHRLWCSKCVRTFTPEGTQVESSNWKADGKGGLWCAYCHDTGRITRRRSTPQLYVGPGDPDGARDVVGAACFACAVVP